MPCAIGVARDADGVLVGNAKVAGLTTELKMHGLQYNTAVTLFFVPYTLLEVPSNIVLKMMRPSRWIAILMFSWGLVMTLMGLIESYGGLLAARFFLGVTEVRPCNHASICQHAHTVSSLASFPLPPSF